MRRRLALLAAVTVTAAPVAALPVGPASAAVPFTVTTLNFRADVAAGQCNVLGDLYLPSSATPATPAAAVLTTNGFGGSKDDQADTAAELAGLGYVVLTYSGLGFGGSGCNITVDDRENDGAAASALVDFLAGADDVAFTDHQREAGWSGPVPGLDVVALDAVDNAGQARTDDPRVGMIGGSYGGQVQFAAAAVDKRIDTLVPLITWHDLVYSLTPNNAFPGTDVSATGPGVFKRQWSDFFTAFGASQVVQHADVTPLPPSTCPGFRPEICPTAAFSNANGYADAEGEAFFSSVSVTDYVSEIDVPVLLGQGQADTLFPLSEAVATYAKLRSAGVPVAMTWHSWGHSRIGAAPGEYPGATGTLGTTYEGRKILTWFDHYLRDAGPTPPLDFTYFRDWAYEAATGSDLERATAAYAAAPAYPLPRTERLFLTGTSGLTPSAATVNSGTATATTPPDAVLESYSETSVVGVLASYGDPDPQPAPSDPPGTFAAWSTGEFTAATDLVGIPTLSMRISADGVDPADPATQPVVFAKLYDVAADGTVELVERLVSPARISTTTAPTTIALPGIVHRVEPGHRLQLVLALSDQAYAGGTPGQAVSFVTEAGAPAVLTLPVAATGAAATMPVAPVEPAVGAGTGAVAGGSVPGTRARNVNVLATTGLPAVVPLLALGLVAVGVVLRRRRS